MSNAFRNCISLKSVVLNIHPKNIEDMSFLFFGCISLTTIDIRLYYFIDNIIYMNYMFYNCHSLKSLEGLEMFNENMRSDEYHDTKYLLDISYMFAGCYSLTSVSFFWFNTENVKNYEGLFYNCESLEFINTIYFTHNNLPSSNLSIFNSKCPLNGTIYINADFYNRTEIPSTLNIKTSYFE